MMEKRTGSGASFGSQIPQKLKDPVMMSKPKTKTNDWDRANSTYKWHYKCSSTLHFGAIKTGFSKRANIDEMPKNKPDYNDVWLLMDKLAMLENNNYFFEKAHRFDFFVKVYDEENDTNFWECFMTLNPGSYFIWQPMMMTNAKWEPLKKWIQTMYHQDSTRRYVTRGSFYGGSETKYVAKFREEPLTELQKQRLGEIPLDDLINARNFPQSYTKDFESCCKFLNYLTFRRQALPSQILNLVEKLNVLHPHIDFKPLQATRY